jgi:hypothetical protein
MAKGYKVKDLNQLPSLFSAAKVEDPFVTQLAADFGKPDPLMDIRDCVVDLMSNYRGWTINDVLMRLKDHPDAKMVAVVMSKYAADGHFTVVRAASGILTYTMKKKIMDTTITAKNAKWVQREPNARIAPDPKGVIRPEEGLDVGIWKVMSDGRARTPFEIRKILAEYKFDSRITDKRLDTLIRTNRWFDRRNQKGSGVAYSLRKDFPMPSLLTSTESISSQSVQPQAEFKEVDFFPKVETSMPNAQIAPAVAAPVFVDHSASMSKEDSVLVLIWKAMSDRKSYKSSEVAALVQAIRPEQPTLRIQNLMSTMKGKGWFYTAPGLNKGGLSVNVWTLRPEITDPTAYTTSPAKPGVTTATTPTVTQAAPAVKPVTTVEEIAMTTSLVQVKVNKAPEAAPLLDLTVRVKGQSFTLAECRQLVHELRNLGYGKTVPPAQSSLVSRSITIKNIEFSESELETIVKALAAEGLVLANK